MLKKRLLQKAITPDLRKKIYFRLISGTVIAIFSFRISVAAEDIKHDCPETTSTVNKKYDKDVVESKIKLLHKIVYDSPTAKRIMHSNNEQAIESLENAKEAHKQSINFLNNDCIDITEQKLNEGLLLIQAASHQVVDIQRKNELSRQRYESLSQRITIFQSAYNRIKKDRKNNMIDFLDEKNLEDLVNTAESEVQKNNYEQANMNLLKAVSMLETALTLAQDKETVVHELKFNSPEEEYAYTIETNNSYIKLLNMLFDNIDPTSKKYHSIKAQLENNQNVLKEAENELSSGHINQAIAVLEKGNIQMIRTLSLTGFNL